MCFPKPDYGASEAREAEEARQQRVGQGRKAIDEVFDEYDQPFYQQRAQSYEDFARPQMQDQYNAALQNLTFALARSGRLNSSVAARRKAKAQESFDTQQQQIAAKGQEFASELERGMGDARAQMHQQNISAADPELAASLAASEARVQQTPPVFNPLVNAFEHFTKGLATQQDWEKRQRLRNAMLSLDAGDRSTILGG